MSDNSKPHKNTLKLAGFVQEIVDANYEPGRQDRSKEWVYRNIVRHVYPMSRSSFYRYLRLHRESQLAQARKEFEAKQPTLFDQ